MSVSPLPVPVLGEHILGLAAADAVPVETLMGCQDFRRLIHAQVLEPATELTKVEELLELALGWQEDENVQPKRRGNMPISEMEKAIWVGRLILTPNGEPGTSDFLSTKARIESQCDDMPGVHASRYTGNLSNYWKTYIRELETYLKDHHDPDSVAGHPRRKRSPGRPGQSLLPLERRLLGLSGQLQEALGELAGARPRAGEPDGRRTVVPQTMYVRRRIQQGILDRLGEERGGPAVELVIGEAGHGKSTLLWGLHQDLQAQPRTIPLLISAAWLRPAPGHDALVSGDDLQRAAEGLGASGSQVVVLLDTADLLLHNERARLELVQLVKALQSANVAVVLTTRPAEALFLPPGLGHIARLGEYDISGELPQAIKALAAAFSRRGNRDGIASSLTRAVARGLPVATVCQSPLMLRMLFELSAPESPSTEIDVTALYTRYWAQRVVQDRGPGRDIDHAGVDLSLEAGHVALTMLAGGSPEIRDEELSELKRPGSGNLPIREAVDILVRRGVLLRTGDYLRFFHQTMFEFAAASALGPKDPVKVLATLLGRMQERPADLFVGAVLEQTLILFGRQRKKREAVTETVGALLGSEQESLQSIGVVAWAHHPWLPPPNERIFAELPTEVSRSFIRVVPRVIDISMANVEPHFTAIWQRREAGLCQELLEAMDRLKERFPAATARCFEGMDCLDFYLNDHPGGLDNPVLIRLVRSFADTDADLTRTALSRILGGLGTKAGRTTFLKILDYIGTDWGLLGSPTYAHELTAVIEKAQAKKNTHTRSVRQALGQILLANLRSQDTSLDPGKQAQLWLERCDLYCADMETNPTATLPGAQLAALSLLANSLPEESPLLREILARVLSIAGKQPLRQLPTNFLAIILSHQSPAAELLMPKIGEWLGHLPVVPNKLSTQEQLWGSIARATIADTRVSPDVLRAICQTVPAAGHVATWVSADWLVSVLPAAASAGVEAAQEAVLEIAAAPSILSRQSASAFLERATEYLAGNADLIDAFVAVSLLSRASGSLRRALTNPEAPEDKKVVAEAMATYADRLLALSERLLEGHGGDQSSGAELLRELRLSHVVHLEWAQLEPLLKKVTHPQAHAVLIRLMPLVSPEPGDGASTVHGYLQTLAVIREGRLLAVGNSEKAHHSSITNAIRDTWMTLLARSGDPLNIPNALELCLMPLDGTTNNMDTVGFPELTRLLVTTTSGATLPAVLDTLLMAATALLVRGYSDKQQKNASNMLARALALILQTDNSTATPLLLGALKSMPTTLATFVVRTVCQISYVQHRGLLEALLDSDIPPKIKSDIVRELRRRGDPSGSNLFPEMLDA